MDMGNGLFIIGLTLVVGGPVVASYRTIATYIRSRINLRQGRMKSEETSADAAANVNRYVRSEATMRSEEHTSELQSR